MATHIVNDGHVSRPRQLGIGQMLTVTVSAGYAVVEYTTASGATVQNNAAQWLRSARGDAIPSMNYMFDVEVYWRVRPIGGSATMVVDEIPSASSLAAYVDVEGPIRITSTTPAIVLLKEGKSIFTSYSAVFQQVDSNGLAIGVSLTGYANFGPFVGDKLYSISTSGIVDATLGDASLLPFNDQLADRVIAPFRRFVAIGNSLTDYAQLARQTGFFDGDQMYFASLGTSNMGGVTWIVKAFAGPTANTGDVFNIRSDAQGRLQVQGPGDTWGPLVDVSNGGWYRLYSGTSGAYVHVAIRGATTPYANQTGTITATGGKQIWNYDLRGYVAFVAGEFGPAFDDYQAYAIPGCVTSDIVKFVSQVFATRAEAAVLMDMVNDIPQTGGTLAQAQAAIANSKFLIDYISTRVRNLFVQETWPVPNRDATGQKLYALMSSAIRDYCRGKPGVIYVSTSGSMATFSTTIATGRSGVYNADGIHTQAFGAYQGSLNLRAAIRRAYGLTGSLQRINPLDTWDSTLRVGAWNANPTMRGAAGTVSGARITGSAPDSWQAVTSGSTQTCALSRTSSADGEVDWQTMSLANATAGDYNGLHQSVAIPAGINAGDKFQVVVQIMIGAMTGGGLTKLTASATSNTSKNLATVLDLTSGFPVDTFSTENPVLTLRSEPQVLAAGETSFTMRFQAGAAAGATAVISCRLFSIEKYAGQIYMD